MKKIIVLISLASLSYGMIFTKPSTANLSNSPYYSWCSENWNRWYYTEGCDAKNLKSCAIQNCILDQEKNDSTRK